MDKLKQENKELKAQIKNLQEINRLLSLEVRKCQSVHTNPKN